MAQPTKTGYDNSGRGNRWQDWTIAGTSVWFFFSPWILQFGHGISTEHIGPGAGPVLAVSRAAWDAWVLSVIMFFVSVSSTRRLDASQERLNVALSIWVFIAPWVLGFSGAATAAAAWDHWVVGVLVFICAILAIRSSPPRSVETTGPQP